MTTLAYFARVGMPEPIIRSAARAAEDAGLGGFWLNNPPGQDGLTPVAWAAGATTAIRLGTGVVPISAHDPDDIARRVRDLGLPIGRYRLGIGSGIGEHARDRVRAALRALRSQVDCELVVGTLGPLMCSLAGEEADALLLTAVTPAQARRSGELARAAAEAAGRPAPRIYLSMLIGLGDEGRARLEQAGAFLARIPFYAAHFKRTGLTPADISIAAGDARELGDQLATWRGVVDELVVGGATDPDRPHDVLRTIETICSAWQASAS